MNDFHKLCEGDVLVIPFSDVAWTPLFTKAGAIVAESGGFLSHSSIIAREYEIPAIVSVSSACTLKNDTLVTIDGYQGEIIIG
jgi:pyruvate,water dikinase